MSTIFWIWMLIGVSIFISLSTSELLLMVIKYIVPPMVEAVPHLQWVGMAKLLVKLYDFVTQYPISLIVWPCIILCVGIFIYQNKKFQNTKNSLRLAIIVTVISVVFLISSIILAIVGTHMMQDQMVAGMGLGV